MRLPSFDEILMFDVRSFLIQRPYHMMLTKNCSDGGCQIHADVEFDWSTRQWLSPSIFPWRKREITPDEWKSKSYNSDRVFKSLKQVAFVNKSDVKSRLQLMTAYKL